MNTLAANATDILTIDNTEAVTIDPALESLPPVIVVNALRRAPQYIEQAPSRGVYVAAKLNWLLPGLQLSGYRPSPADTLIDGNNTVWTILAAFPLAAEQVWRVETIDLTLAFGLYDVAALLRPTNVQDAAGSRVPTFAAVYQGVPARFQLVTADVKDERGLRFTGRHYQVYVLSQLDLLIEDRLADQAGNVYEVKGWHNPQRIDELQVIDAELHPV